MQLRMVLMAGGLFAGVALGGVARGKQAVRIPIPPPPASQQPTPSDGLEPLINLELEPSAVLKDGAGERLEYLLAVTPRKEATADVAVRYAVEVVGDDGSPLQAPSLSQVIAVQKAGAHSKALDTPAAKRDGYFVIRVQAAAFDGTEETLQIMDVTSR